VIATCCLRVCPSQLSYLLNGRDRIIQPAPTLIWPVRVAMLLGYGMADAAWQYRPVIIVARIGPWRLRMEALTRNLFVLYYGVGVGHYAARCDDRLLRGDPYREASQRAPDLRLFLRIAS